MIPIRLLRDGSHSAPIYFELHPGYLTAEAEDSNTYDHGKEQFFFSVHSMSTVHPQDDVLEDLFENSRVLRFSPSKWLRISRTSHLALGRGCGGPVGCLGAAADGQVGDLIADYLLCAAHGFALSHHCHLPCQRS